MKEKLNDILEETNNFTLISDGWTNIKGHHLVNFVVHVTGQSPMFFKCVDTTSLEMNSENIAKIIIDTAKEIGTDKWASLITDNAPNMQKAWRIIEKEYPLVFCNGCSAHVGNLIIKRICSEESTKILIDKCIALVKFINNHTNKSKNYLK